MGDRRRSERLRNAGSGSGAKRTKDRRTPKGKTRESVGGALGLTPRHPDRRNLTVAKAAEAAAAAAANLDELEVAERSVCKRRASEKGLQAEDDAMRRSYSPVGRDSMAMYSMTHKVFERDEDTYKHQHRHNHMRTREEGVQTHRWVGRVFMSVAEPSETKSG